MKKEAFAVYTNTDLTEGRGLQYPLYVCEYESSAIRLAKGRGVQGSNATIHRVEILNHNNMLYGPVKLVRPDEEDLRVQNEIDKQRRIQEQKNAVLEKAKQLGLTEDEIKVLRS